MATRGFSGAERAEDGSGPRRAARRLIRPIAVETDDTEIDFPVHADHAGIFADRIEDRVF